MHLRKLAIPVQQQVKELAARAIAARRLVHVALVVDAVVADLTCIHVAWEGRVEGRCLLMADPVAVVSVVAEASGEAQARRNELQVLLQRDVALQVVGPVLVVARLRGRHPRVDHGRVATTDVDHRHVAIAILDGRKQWVVAEELSPDVVIVHPYVEFVLAAVDLLLRAVAQLSGTIALREVARHAELQQRGRCNVDVDVQSVVPTLVVGIGVVFLAQRLVGLIHTLVLDVRHRCIVARGVAAATQVHVATIAPCAVAQQQVHPVDVRIEVGVDAGADDVDFLRLIVNGLIARDTCLVDQVGIADAIDKLGCLGACVVAGLQLAIHLNFARLTMFCGNQDDAIGTLRAIDGRGRRVLQHRERLDVLDVQVVDVVALEAIYEDVSL